MEIELECLPRKFYFVTQLLKRTRDTLEKSILPWSLSYNAPKFEGMNYVCKIKSILIFFGVLNVYQSAVFTLDIILSLLLSFS